MRRLGQLSVLQQHLPKSQTTRSDADAGWAEIGFFLLAMISMFLFPLFRRELAGNPVLQEKMIWGLLTPLAIADVGTASANCIRVDGGR